MRSLDFKHILVPTDLTAESVVSLRYARFFAERFASKITILYVDPITFLGPEIAVTLPEDVVTTPAHLGKLQHDVRDWAGRELDGLNFDITATLGPPAAMIVNEEKHAHADLVVMATHGLHGWRRLILGSVTEGVLRAGLAPVLSVNRTEPGLKKAKPIHRILCPVNFTDVARQSLDYAAQLAAAFDSELIVVHVVEQPDELREAAGEIDIRAWIAPAIQDRCTYREIVMRGGASERVLDAAEDFEAGLIVIGAQHKRFRNETVIGTTTERLVRFARVPVLSIPSPVATEVTAGAESELANAL